MLKKLREWFRKQTNGFYTTHKLDPIKECDLYKDKDCVFVDGPFCDFPNCSMLKKYKDMDIIVLPQVDFDQYCEDNDITDENVETQKDKAFISIIGTSEVLEYYLHEPHTEHWFKQEHPNVLNLEFDDVSEDREFEYKNGHGEVKIVHAYAMNEKQAESIYNFIENNKGKTFVIHCKAAFSRSPAIGWFIHDFVDGYENCKGKEYLQRTKPNGDVLAKLKKIWYYKHKFFV